MDKTARNIIVCLSVVVVILLGALGAGSVYLIKVKRELAALQSHSRHRPVPVWTSGETAAADSVEGQLKAEGKHWVKVPGDITVGAYVQDTLEGRMGQPKGRGAIAKVVAVTGPNDPPPPAATVDFGRGYQTGINFSELSLVEISNN